MPKKSYKKSNKYSGKQRWSNYKRGGMQLYRDVQMLKSLINVEKKFVDVSTNATAVSSTGSVLLMNGVAQGTNLTDRIGDSIKMKTMQLQGIVTLNVAATNDLVRVAIILDKQPNSAAPTYTDVYESNSGFAYRNKLTVDRFVVLKEYQLALATAGETIRKFDCYLNLPNNKDAHTKYNGTGATISSIYTNSVYILYCGQQPTNTSALSLNSRIRYVDN